MAGVPAVLRQSLLAWEGAAADAAPRSTPGRARWAGVGRTIPFRGRVTRVPAVLAEGLHGAERPAASGAAPRAVGIRRVVAAGGPACEDAISRSEDGEGLGLQHVDARGHLLALN